MLARSWPGRLAYAVYFCIIVGLAGLGSPRYHWDVLGYAGVVLSYESRDPAVIHGGAYGALREVAPAPAVDALTTGLPYRAEMARNPDAFVEQLSFYRMRVVFSSLVYLLYKAGVNVVQAASAVSALSYVLLSALGLFWIRRYLDPLWAVLLSSLVFLSLPFTQLARVQSPDGLTALVVVAAAYALLEMRRRPLAFTLLTAAVFVRHESAILGLMLSASVLALDRAEPLRARLARFAGSSAAILGAYVFVSRFYGGYGWRTLFHHTFIEHLVYPASDAAPVGVADYLRVVARDLVPGALASFAALYLLLLAIAVVSHVRSRGRRALEDPWVMIPCVLLLNLVVRSALFPAVWDRFFVAHYLIFAILAIRTLWLSFRDVSGIIALPPVAVVGQPSIQAADADAAERSSA